jgi:DNA-binding response OmpR family regulator
MCADHIPAYLRTTPESVAEFSTGKPLVFAVQDDPAIGELTCHYLRIHGYATRWFAEPSEVIAQAKRTPPALFLLDTMFAGGDSFELCRQIRRTGALAGCRIIFLTAKIREGDGINGLELGGDAYITKPFSPRELVARVRTVLRRTPEPEAARVARFGRIEIDSSLMTIKVDGEPVPTTMREFRLLDYFAHRSSRVFTRSQLLDAVWAEGSFVTQRSIDVYVRRLREKIEPDPENPIYLIAVRGIGYRFDIPR